VTKFGILRKIPVNSAGNLQDLPNLLRKGGGFVTRSADRQSKIETEKQRLEAELANGDFRTLRARVALILSRHKQARNSDLELQQWYWATFYPEQYTYGQNVSYEEMKNMERLTHLARMRAKIQNEFEMYVADDAIQQERKRRAQVTRENISYDQPSTAPVSAVYCDETGKNSTLMGVGGIWFADVSGAWELQRALTKWRTTKHIKAKEFHFTKLSSGLVPHAKDFFQEALKHAGWFGFKAVLVPTSGLVHKVDDALRELHYQLIYQGIEHDLSAGRVTYPRGIALWKDQDEGWDGLHVQRLSDDLRVALTRRYGTDVEFREVLPVKSELSFLIQLSDLFMGSLNRTLERAQRQDDQPHFKDEMAEYILNALNVSFSGGRFDSSDEDFVSIKLIGAGDPLAIYATNEESI
jgi:hypothetical protein